MRIPQHVAIIMDGNGRWAKKRGLPRIKGHQRGAEVLHNTVKWSLELGIKYLTAFSFSTENWKRPKEEVEFLMDLFVQMIDREMELLRKERVRVRILGRKEGLSEKVLKKWQEVEEKTKEFDRMTLIIAFNYGGRREILDAVESILKDVSRGKKLELTEETFRQYLYLPDVPDPDLIIRTSGEMRLSNFLLWQSAYSELYFFKKLWPDFTKRDFLRAIESYSKRERRFGGLSNG
ncbi:MULTISPECIES: isoprenyl transferase [Thermotoga]|uniref:isoprenyl transferase n=1 Tax=Thermotoga TaxID=2335 RepID=UPI000543EB6F|nr:MULTISPECIES: isoprenyl transferase [unclassified Thermotoga]KHC93798.1 undecaprenyl pyrophosphate synthase [Thermotoga sp. TBGT1765]KHC94277.1 undecaprenyl pyrophosphate synthase [Thermotoga sp. TBGT1766]KHC95786.1 undecaprenyl pyrophosphate synthase [Thermotoga sp. Xyl54]MBZ4661877.1 undecaprenyl pyrophosphate synthase [Thermotoga sp.]